MTLKELKNELSKLKVSDDTEILLNCARNKYDDFYVKLGDITVFKKSSFITLEPELEDIESMY